MHDLVLNVGNSTLGGAFFEKDALSETFHLPSRPLSLPKFNDFIKGKKIRHALIGADNLNAGHLVKKALTEHKVPHSFVSSENLSVVLDVEKPEEVGADRIANTYGALYVHPGEDAIVIDMGTAVTFDVVSKERKFLGGAIYPGLYMSAKALKEGTDKLPLVSIEKPQGPLSRSTVGNIQSGLYYGLIGSIEKIIHVIIQSRFKSSKVAVIATGGLASDRPDSLVSARFRQELEHDLKGIVHYFEPDLTFIGLHQLLKEQLRS